MNLLTSDEYPAYQKAIFRGVGDRPGTAAERPSGPSQEAGPGAARWHLRSDLVRRPVPAGKLLQVFAVGAVSDSNEQNPFQVVTNLVDLPTATTPTTAAPTTTMPSAGAAGAADTSPSFTG